MRFFDRTSSNLDQLFFSAFVQALIYSLALCTYCLGEEILIPYSGESKTAVDTSTLDQKVMCGYQGWFNCAGDGAELGWTHWARNPHRMFAPDNLTVDLWPDMSEYDPDERFKTGFTDADGTAAEVFSSYNPKTVQRHFQWMRDYGIDGAFIQRFANELDSKKKTHHKNVVLANARRSANLTGRSYAVMYDLSGLKSGETISVRRDLEFTTR